MIEYRNCKDHGEELKAKAPPLICYLLLERKGIRVYYVLIKNCHILNVVKVIMHLIQNITLVMQGNLNGMGAHYSQG